jgi:hypothetical protein
VDAGRKQPGLHEVEVIGREGERPIQVVDLCDSLLATIPNNDDSGMGAVISNSSPGALRQISNRITYLKPQIFWHIVRAHLWGYIYADDLMVTPVLMIVGVGDGACHLPRNRGTAQQHR